MLSSRNMAASRGISSGAYLLLILLALFFLSLRLWHLDADFPAGITASGELLTDEGWYANSALRDFYGAGWYRSGDFNPAVNMPVGQIIHRLVFTLTAPSLWSARLTVTICSLLIALLLARLVQKNHGGSAAIFCLLLIALNSFGFAYSRFSFMEPIGVVWILAAIYLLIRGDAQPAIWQLMLAVAFVVLATLTKGSMIFGVPVLAYSVWLSYGQDRRGAKISLITLLIALGVMGSYMVYASHVWPYDYAYFGKINVSARLINGVSAWPANFLRQTIRIACLGELFVASTITMALFACHVSQEFRSAKLPRVMFAYCLCYLGALSLVDYGPPRYFFPFLIPLCVLNACSITPILNYLRQRPKYFSHLVIGVFAMMLFFEAQKTAAYAMHPAYSYLSMMRGVGREVYQREGRVIGVPILGQVADSVAIETGAFAINSEVGVASMKERMLRYRPRYVVLQSDDKPVLDALGSLGLHLSYIASWDVYGNYYKSRLPVRLYKVLY